MNKFAQFHQNNAGNDISADSINQIEIEIAERAPDDKAVLNVYDIYLETINVIAFKSTKE